MWPVYCSYFAHRTVMGNNASFEGITYDSLSKQEKVSFDDARKIFKYFGLLFLFSISE